MKRRNFIKNTGLGVVAPSLLTGLPSLAHSANILDAILTTDTDHVLVLIYLGGGNDGLNTVLPLDSYSKLASARANILIPENKVLKLNGVVNTGLHPSMTGLQNLYNEGKLSIIQSVGYQNQDFSHFRSTDIWTTGSDANQVLDSGWLGRYLNEEFPGFPFNYPSATNPDPLALQLFASLPSLFQGPNAQMSVTISDPNSLFQVWSHGIKDAANNLPYGKELSYIRTIALQSEKYAQSIIANYTKGENKGTYPNANNMGDILKAIARLIKGGSKTRIYLLNLYGFDTHSEQVDATDTTKGAHADLLKTVSDAIFSFQKDIEALGIADRVLGMTFSEFGRRIKSNFSVGTDHGAAAPLFIFGTKVKGGIIGSNPFIPAQVSVNDNLPMQYDFRSVYSSVLKDWFCLTDSTLDKVMLKKYALLPIAQNNCTTSTIDEFNLAESNLILKLSPNPMTDTSKIEITIQEGKTSLTLIDALGRVVKTIYSGKLTAGNHTFVLEKELLKTGNYYIRLMNNSIQKTELLMVL